MAKRKYIVALSEIERKQLLNLIKSGKSSARSILHANIILAADINAVNLKNSEIAERCHTSKTTVQNVLALYGKTGLQSAIYRKKRITPPVKSKMDGNLEAHIIALCCSEPPKGYSRWSLRLLAQKCVELNYAEEMSHTTIQKVLKKTNLSLT